MGGEFEVNIPHLKLQTIFIFMQTKICKAKEVEKETEKRVDGN